MYSVAYYSSQDGKNTHYCVKRREKTIVRTQDGKFAEALAQSMNKIVKTDLHSLCDRLNEVLNEDDTPDELSQEARKAIEELWKQRDKLLALTIQLVKEEGQP